MTDIEALCPREEFPPLRDDEEPALVYLDSAATSLTPFVVIDAIRSYYMTSSANIHRGKHMLSDLASEEYEACRFAVAQFLQVPHGEVVLTRNSTHGLNLLANGLDRPTGSRVLVAGDMHHSALLPWQRRGEVRRIGVGHDGQVSFDEFLAAVETGPPPSVVVLGHCSNVAGSYLDLPTWVSAARQTGALVILDAAQSAPHRALRPVELGVDAVVFSAHKMLGPTGLGVLWGTTELLERLDPAEIGGGTVDWVDDSGFRWRSLPHRLEAGTPDIAAAYGFRAAIRYLQHLDMRAVEQHDHRLGELMVAEARRRGLRFLGEESDTERAATLSLCWPGAPTGSMDVLARALSDSYRVMCRTGYLCAQPLVTAAAGGAVLRMSAYVYNSGHDVIRGFDALDELLASGLVSRG